MHLDMLTMSAVDITVTAILGFALIFTWARERATNFVGWWGLAMLLQSAGVVIAGVAGLHNDGDLVTVGTATMVLADAMKWKACREFADRRTNVSWTFLGPAVFFVIAHSGSFESFDQRLILACTIMAAYNFAAALELSRAKGKRLISHWPATTLLVITGVSYLTWWPLDPSAPIHQAADVFSSGWFPAVNLVTVLIRVALAFIVLAMAKDRQEMEQRVDALTDLLTGLPNRRGMFDAIDLLGREKAQQPVSVLLFDLDHFKRVNDRFGHLVGDSVLKLFAKTANDQLNGGAIVGRVGGEEFAAVLPGVGPASAVGAAEAVRRAFAKSAAFLDGVAVGATVSAGAASSGDGHPDLGSLFRQADTALYAAKRAGRNRVELAEPGEKAFAEIGARVRSAPRRKANGPEHDVIPIRVGA